MKFIKILIGVMLLIGLSGGFLPETAFSKDTWFIEGNNEIIGHRPGYIAPEQLKALLKMFMAADPEQ